jgi:hypothetical protein
VGSRKLLWPTVIGLHSVALIFNCAEIYNQQGMRVENRTRINQEARDVMSTVQKYCDLMLVFMASLIGRSSLVVSK